MSIQCSGDEHPKRGDYNRDALERACREELARAYHSLDLARARMMLFNLKPKADTRQLHDDWSVYYDVRAQ